MVLRSNVSKKRKTGISKLFIKLGVVNLIKTHIFGKTSYTVFFSREVIQPYLSHSSVTTWKFKTLNWIFGLRWIKENSTYLKKTEIGIEGLRVLNSKEMELSRLKVDLKKGQSPVSRQQERLFVSCDESSLVC